MAPAMSRMTAITMPTMAPTGKVEALVLVTLVAPGGVELLLETGSMGTTLLCALEKRASEMEKFECS